MKQLLEAGVHFGHQTRKWNPKMKKYIYGERNDIHIINLQMTVELIEKAYAFIVEQVKAGKSVLFVGTKRQAQDAIKEEAERCEMFYINSRWLGGTLTNYKTIKSRIDRLNKLENMEKTGELSLFTKKEAQELRNEMQKLETNLGGIKNMKGLPGVMFVVDPSCEQNAIKEAKSLNIPIVAITDTNCDPDDIDYVISGNDDAIRAVKLIAGVIADAVIEARQGESLGEVAVEETPVEEIKEFVPEETEKPKRKPRAKKVAEDKPE